MNDTVDFKKQLPVPCWSNLTALLRDDLYGCEGYEKNSPVCRGAVAPKSLLKNIRKTFCEFNGITGVY